MPIPTLAQLRRSINISEQIEKLQSELASVFSGIAVAIAPAHENAASTKGKRRKGKMSAAGRARIIAAQKARWAKVRSIATKGVSPVVNAVVAKPKKKKGKMSAAGRANIIAAQKARWAKVKAGKSKKK